MVWGAFCGTVKSDVVFIPGKATLDSALYVQNVMEPQLVPFWHYCCEVHGWVAVMEDGAPGHKEFAKHYRQLNEMEHLPWPAHQQNVKTSPGPPRGIMVPLVLLVHPDPPWSTSLVRFQKVWIRMDRSGPGGPRGPQPPLVDQERSGLLWTMLRHFPDGPTVL